MIYWHRWKKYSTALWTKFYNSHYSWIQEKKKYLIKWVLKCLIKKYTEYFFSDQISLLKQYHDLIKECENDNLLMHQFDLIRWSNEPNKKEIYINQVNNYFSENKYLITKKIIENFEKIIKNNYLQFYTEFSPSWIHNTLEKYNLTNNPNQSSIYSRDTNASFNKVDHFVEKIIQVIDNEWNIHISQDHDIIDISWLKDGTYTMQILLTHYKFLNSIKNIFFD